MPIKIPDKLPAFDTLVSEGVRVMTEAVAIRQDIRPLQIGLLNLMPNKIKTELQIARLLGASPLQIELSLVTVGSYKPKNTPKTISAPFMRRGKRRSTARSTVSSLPEPPSRQSRSRMSATGRKCAISWSGRKPTSIPP